MSRGNRSNGSLSRDAAAACVALLAAVLLLNIFFSYALSAILPFGIAWLTASAVRPVARFVSRKCRASVKACGGVIICLVLFGIGYAAFSLGGKLIREMTELVSGAVAELEKEDNIIRRIIDFAEALPEKYPILSVLKRGEGTAFSDELYGFAISAAREAAGKLSQAVTSWAAGFIKALPGFVFSVAVGVVALFYMTVDPDGIKEGIRTIIGDGAFAKLKELYSGTARGVGGYIRAYFVLMTLTFTELLIGLAVLDVKYAFFLALLIAVVDILPLLGAGCVLIPWSAVLFISGDTSRAVGMLILLGVMYVIRQFAEPRLIGRFMGIHPLLTLGAAFAGFRFFGFSGMVVFPIILYIVKLAVSEKGERVSMGRT